MIRSTDSDMPIASLSNQAILRTLAVAVRFLTLEQLMRLRGCDRRSAREFGKRMVERGLVEQVRLLAEPIDVCGPLASWKPGEPPPDATAISRAAISRYHNSSLREMVAFTATGRTCQHFGMPQRPPLKCYQQTHDLGLSETFLYFWSRWPRVTSGCWLGEDAYRHQRGYGEKIEDARIRHRRTGDTLLIIEFMGKYKTCRVADFIAHVTARQIPFLCF